MINSANIKNSVSVKNVALVALQEARKKGVADIPEVIRYCQGSELFIMHTHK
jgi:hypothetical protein